MKKTSNSILLVILSLLLIFSFAACNSVKTEESSSASSQIEQPKTSDDSSSEVPEIERTGLWENATYLSDKEFGEGSKTLVVEVKAGDESVTFTVKTDKATVGEALQEYDLIDGEEGEYGLYVKVVNGITADYDIDKSYWAFYINGEYAMGGVDTTDITDGVVYKLEYTK